MVVEAPGRGEVGQGGMLNEEGRVGSGVSILHFGAGSGVE
jgi:hypothetical protein